MIIKCSTTLGALKALTAFFAKLERLGVGTRRAEGMASDIECQNVLRSGSKDMKARGKSNQEKQESRRTVRII